MVISDLIFEADTVCVVDTAGTDSGKVQTGASLPSTMETLTNTGFNLWEYNYNELSTGIDYIEIELTVGGTTCAGGIVLNGIIYYQISCDNTDGTLTVEIWFEPENGKRFNIFTGSGFLGDSIENESTASGTPNYIAYNGSITVSSP